MCTTVHHHRQQHGAPFKMQNHHARRRAPCKTICWPMRRPGSAPCALQAASLPQGSAVSLPYGSSGACCSDALHTVRRNARWRQLLQQCHIWRPACTQRRGQALPRATLRLPPPPRRLPSPSSRRLSAPPSGWTESLRLHRPRRRLPPLLLLALVAEGQVAARLRLGRGRARAAGRLGQQEPRLVRSCRCRAQRHQRRRQARQAVATACWPSWSATRCAAQHLGRLRVVGSYASRGQGGRFVSMPNAPGASSRVKPVKHGTRLLAKLQRDKMRCSALGVGKVGWQLSWQGS
jgi:hypothetical protein